MVLFIKDGYNLEKYEILIHTGDSTLRNTNNNYK